MQKLIIVRGAPGSGKSTFAKTFTGFYHYENDMYRYDRYGNYNNSQDDILKYINRCFRDACIALFAGVNVVVSNCYTKENTIFELIEFAKECGATIEIYELKTRFQNIHEVPAEQVEKIINRFQPYSKGTEVENNEQYRKVIV